MTAVLPVAAVIPTRNRARRLRATLASLAAQSHHPAQVIIVDASDSPGDGGQVDFGLAGELQWVTARSRGAAAQRTEAMACVRQPFLLLLDDDVDLHPGCIRALYTALKADEGLGAVNALIDNQSFQAPGRLTRWVLRLLGCRDADALAGRVLFGAVNFLPGPAPGPVTATDWLNTTCAMYRLEALPRPLFPEFFEGYAQCEDLYLSRRIARYWRLANVPAARIFHDSQPGDHKANAARVAAQLVRNRTFVLLTTASGPRLPDLLRVLAWEFYTGLAASLGSPDGFGVLRGKLRGAGQALALWRRREQLVRSP